MKQTLQMFSKSPSLSPDRWHYLTAKKNKNKAIATFLEVIFLYRSRKQVFFSVTSKSVTTWQLIGLYKLT